MLHNTKPQKTLKTGEPMGAFQFESPDKTIVVAWADKAPKTISVKGIPSLKVYDIYGNLAGEGDHTADLTESLLYYVADLAEAEKHNHPIKNALQKTVIVMQAQILEMREKLTALKQSVIEGCKNAVAAFKEKGITALDNIARFFKVKPILEAIHTGADKTAGQTDKAVANIEAASKRYHEAEKHIKNAGRAITGKETIQEAKPPGMIAKAFSAPVRATGLCFRGIRKSAAAMTRKLNELEERAKPSIYGDMEKHNEQIEREEREAPTRTRSKPTAER